MLCTLFWVQAGFAGDWLNGVLVVIQVARQLL